MRNRFLKSVGILFSLAFMVACFMPMNAKAAGIEAGERLKGGDVINYDGAIYLFDEDHMCVDSGVGTLTIKDSYSVRMYGYLDCDLIPLSIWSVDAYPGYVNIYLEYALFDSSCEHILTCSYTDDEKHIYECIMCNDAFFDMHDSVDGVTCRDCGCVLAGAQAPTQTPAAECAHDWYVDVATPGDAYVHAVVCGKCGVGGANVHVFANGVDGVCLECGAEIIDSSSYAAVYDASYYAEANPDLKAVFGDNEDLLFGHFIACGMAEGRQTSAEFNVHAYRANNPDLVAAFGDNLASYYQHYMNSGKAEGRLAK